MSLLNKFKYDFYRFKYKYAPQLYLSRPVDVSLEIISACDLSCLFCYHNDKKNLPFKMGKMDTKLAFIIIDQCADLGVHSFKPNYRGESTLHPDFEIITRHAKLQANGMTLMDRITNSNFNFNTENDSIFRGLANQTKVKVSIDSFRKDILEKQRKGAVYERVMANIEKFYNHESRIKSETKIVIQAVRTLLNKEEDIEGISKSKWPEAEISIRDMVSGRINKDLTDLENKKRDLNNRQSCLQAHNRLIVGYDGRVQACCPDIGSQLILGDANKETIYDIFNSEKAKELRSSLKNKTAFASEPCKNCPSFESFKGYKHPKTS